jgi:formate transporter
MDYVLPAQIVSDALRAAEAKVRLSIPNLLLRGALAGAFLGYATSLVFVILSQGLPPIVGAIIFPVGFVMLVLLGLELATGNFALLPAAWMGGRVSGADILRNWTFVYLGNLLGSLLYAYLFYLAITSFGANNGGALGDQLRSVAQKKTVAYAALGAAGWGTALVKGVLCNWMVTIGTMLAFASRSTAGKILGMWLPITTFFAQGFEHSIVNMFAIPAGMLLGAPVSSSQWWLWNQLPVTLGNIFAGALLTGIALWYTYAAKPEHAARSSEPEAAVAVAKAG